MIHEVVPHCKSLAASVASYLHYTKQKKKKTDGMAEEEEETPLLLPCSICNRTFIPSSLEKHKKICEKTTSKKRGVFNSFKQRLQGTGLEEFLPLSQININSTLNVSESKWRQKHLDFVNTVRQARGIQNSCTDKKRSASFSTRHISSTSNETCPYCQRSFGIKAFDRHLEWCKEQKARIPKSTPSSQAKERLEARTKYRAPLGSKSKRTTTKEKYSSITNLVKPKSPTAYGSNIVKSPSVTSVKDDKRNQGLKPLRNNDVQHPLVTGSRRAKTATIRHVSIPSRITSSTVGQLSSPILRNNPVINKHKKSTTSLQEISVANAERIGSLNISAVNRRNRRNHGVKNREMPQAYDPFEHAERQMQDLMGPEEQWHSEEQADIQRQKDHQYSTIYLPTSSEPCTSPVSAFAKYSIFKSDDELESYLEKLQDENQNNDRSYTKSEEKISADMLHKLSHSFLHSIPEQQTTVKRESTSELDSIQDLHSLSLDNFDSDFEKEKIMIENDTCSLDGNLDFNSFPFEMENFKNEIERIAGSRKKNTKYRAKLENAALALQQSVSLYHPGPLVKPSEEFFPSSESENESSSHLFQKMSFIHSLQDLNSTNSQEKTSAVSKAIISKDENYINTESEIHCITDNQVNTEYAAGSKLSGDSAYSSLNRKSPPAEVTPQMFEICPEVPLELPELNMDNFESPAVASVETRHEAEDPGTYTPPQPLSSLQLDSSSKSSSFCHNCGLRYPVASAKFCCECGIKRLCI